MQKHTKLYMDFFGYDKSDFIPCEVCGKPANDCHHVKARGMGGTKKKDVIENLMALCRSCHEALGDKKQHREYLQTIHNLKIKRHEHRAN